MISRISELADRLLRLPELKDFHEDDFDSLQAAILAREIMQNKKIMSVLYDEYCRPFVESAVRAPQGAAMLEIGAGTSPLKQKMNSEILTSDVIAMPWLDLSCSAYALPFPDASLDRIFLMFTFHHLGQARTFLDEARRCLKSGGELVLIDPAITLYSKLYYRVHVDEMDLDTPAWGFDGLGRLSDSNIALAWIIFFRDRLKFHELYPEFNITNIEYNTTLTFLLSGGLRIRQLLPTFILKALFKTENWVIRHITHQLAVTMAVTLKRA